MIDDKQRQELIERARTHFAQNHINCSMTCSKESDWKNDCLVCSFAPLMVDFHIQESKKDKERIKELESKLDQCQNEKREMIENGLRVANEKLINESR